MVNMLAGLHDEFRRFGDELPGGVDGFIFIYQNIDLITHFEED